MLKVIHTMRVNDREFEVVLSIDVTPFREEHKVGSYRGLSTDNMADAFVEEMFLRGKTRHVELCYGHRFFDLVQDDAELFELIVSQHGGYW